VTIVTVKVEASVAGVTAATFTDAAKEVFIDSLMDAMLYVGGLRLQRDWIRILSITDTARRWRTRRRQLDGGDPRILSSSGVDIEYEIQAVTEAMCSSCTNAQATVDSMLEKLADTSVASSMTTTMAASTELSAASMSTMTVTESVVENNTGAPTSAPTVAPGLPQYFFYVFSSVFCLVGVVSGALGYHYRVRGKLAQLSLSSGDDDEDEDSKLERGGEEDVENGGGVDVFSGNAGEEEDEGQLGSERDTTSTGTTTGAGTSTTNISSSSSGGVVIHFVDSTGEKLHKTESSHPHTPTPKKSPKKGRLLLL
jgi:hypothetical protein